MGTECLYEVIFVDQWDNAVIPIDEVDRVFPRIRERFPEGGRVAPLPFPMTPAPERS